MKRKEDLLSILRELGLNENEAAVYLAALELGSSTVAQISRKALVKRTTTYSVIESLRAQGLMGVVEKGLKQYFVPEDPRQLNMMLERREQRLKEAFPEFQALFNLEGNNSIIKYYEGIEGVKLVSDQLLEELRYGMEYFVVGDAERWNQVDTKHFERFMKKRQKIRLNAKTLLIDSPTGEVYKKSAQNEEEEVRLLPKGTNIDVNVVIVPHKLIIQQLVDPVLTVVIENKSIINLQRSLFNIIWETAMPN